MIAGDSSPLITPCVLLSEHGYSKGPFKFDGDFEWVLFANDNLAMERRRRRRRIGTRGLWKVSLFMNASCADVTKDDGRWKTMPRRWRFACSSEVQLNIKVPKRLPSLLECPCTVLYCILNPTWPCITPNSAAPHLSWLCFLARIRYIVHTGTGETSSSGIAFILIITIYIYIRHQAHHPI